MAPRWPIYRLEGDAAAVARLRARSGSTTRARELPCDPGGAEKLTAEVFGHGARRRTWPTGGATPARRWRSSAGGMPPPAFAVSAGEPYRAGGGTRRDGAPSRLVAAA